MVCIWSMCDSLTDSDSDLHFLRECSHTSMKEKRQFDLYNLIKYAVRLDCLSNTALEDVCLLANILDEQTVIAILNIVCEMHDLRFYLYLLYIF